MTTRTVEQQANRALRIASKIGFKLPEQRSYKNQRIADDNKEISAFLFKALALMVCYIISMLFIAEATLNTEQAVVNHSQIERITR